MVTFTSPAPASPCTSMLASSSCICFMFSCMACACFMMSPRPFMALPHSELFASTIQRADGIFPQGGRKGIDQLLHQGIVLHGAQGARLSLRLQACADGRGCFRTHRTNLDIHLEGLGEMVAENVRQALLVRLVIEGAVALVEQELQNIATAA